MQNEVRMKVFFKNDIALRRNMWISSCDICVIVDNSVETGDFFWNRGFLDKFCSLFFSERLQDNKCKSRKILRWSIEIGFILTGWVFLGVSYTES